MKYLVKVLDNGNWEVKHKTSAKHKPRGGQYELLESEVELVNAVVEVVEGRPTLIEDAAKLVEAQIAVKYKELVDAVYTEMQSVFGTRNDVSASATAATWEAMLKRPNKYIDVELGLPDKLSVEAYATAKLDDADAYGMFRMKRLKQYQDEKAAILNP